MLMLAAIFPKRPLALLVTALLSAASLNHAVIAAPVGNLTALQQQTGLLQLSTDTNVAIELQLLKPDLLRIRAGLAGVLTDEGSKAAPIVIKTDYTQVAYQLKDMGDYQLVSTEAMALRIYKKPLTFALYKADNQTLIVQELQPLELNDSKGSAQSVQTLSTAPDERFYGGGQQNGAFEFKGKSMEISYSGGWEEGDRPSPAPFYLSSKGYGVLRNTWANGSYDFRSAEYLNLSHQEGRFDAYYFVGGSVQDVLADYTELTGRAKLIPRWAFEYGDADCYNDGDNGKKPAQCRMAGVTAQPAPRRMWWILLRKNTVNTICRAAGFYPTTATAVVTPIYPKWLKAWLNTVSEPAFGLKTASIKSPGKLALPAPARKNSMWPGPVRVISLP